jgi:hypothetical protein
MEIKRLSLLDYVPSLPLLDDNQYSDTMFQETYGDLNSFNRATTQEVDANEIENPFKQAKKYQH